MTLKQIRDFALANIKAITADQVIDFRLEQIENINNEWDVVVSFLTTNLNQPESNSGLLGLSQQISKTPYERVFKRILMDDSGKLIKLLIFK